METFSPKRFEEAPEAGTPPSGMRAIERAPKLHALVVDDSLTVRMELRSLLTEAGFAVTACETKASAERAIRSRPYSIFLLDVLLPDGSGIDLLREIKARPELMRVPTIMLSSEAEVRDRIRGLTTGADDYIGKPFGRAYLRRRILELTRKPEGAALAASEQEGGEKLVLLEGNLAYRKRLGEKLREEGHDVVLASDGADVLNLLASDRVDLAILDLQTPGISVVDICRRVHRDPSLLHVGLLVLAGRGTPKELRDEATAAGADEVIIKSQEIDLVQVLIQSVLRRKRAESGEAPQAGEAKPGRGAWRNQDEVPQGSLLYNVITRGGLSSIIGPSTIARAIDRAGVDPRSMTAPALRRALPAIRETLSLFLLPDECERRLTAIEALAQGAPLASP